MTGERTTSTYVVAGPYEKVLKRLRRALQEEGLRIPVEMDVSDTIRRELGVDLLPSRVLGVCCPLLLLEAVVMDAAAPAFLPLHLVVTGSDTRTLVRLVDPAQQVESALPRRLSIPLGRLLARVQKVLERIGARDVAYERV